MMGVAGTPERDVRERFRHSGYTLTSQRRAVLDALKDFKGHPSAEEVYLAVKKRNPKVALRTVYQALSVLEEIGLIEAKRWSETPVRYDLNTEPHHDIRCTKCGAVAEIPGVEVAGKTGTAEDPPREPHSWFVSFAPADDPEIAVAVMVENGGVIDEDGDAATPAIPIAQDLMETYLRDGGG